MIQPKLLQKLNILEEDIQIFREKNSTRKINNEIEIQLEEIWNRIQTEAITQNKKIYNGICYRLEGFNKIENNYLLSVSTIEFKTRRPLTILTKEGFLDKLNEEYYSKAISIGGFIETVDHKYLFGVRSGKTLATNSIDFIGGSWEEEYETNLNIFANNRKEILEEINIPKENIISMKIIGEVLTSSGEIIFITSTKLDLNEDQVRQKFKEKNDEEMSDIIFKEKHQLKDFLLELQSYKPVLIELIDKI